MLIPIIGWILFGLFVGAIARLIVPGRQRIGVLRTILLGIVGSFVGGLLAFLVFGGEPIQPTSWIGSIIGAVLVLVVGMRMSRAHG